MSSPNYTFNDATSSAKGVIRIAGDLGGTASAPTVPGLVAAQTQVAGTNVQTGATYTLVLSDAGKVIEMNSSSAQTLTIPTNASIAFPVGTILEVCQLGVGQTTIAAAAGVTLLTPSTGGFKLAVQYASASIRQRATDIWIVSGYTSP